MDKGLDLIRKAILGVLGYFALITVTIFWEIGRRKGLK